MVQSAAYRVFDAHTHAFPDKVAARAMEVLCGAAELTNYHDGTLDGLLAYERRGGASGFLLQPIATKVASVTSINNWVASRCGGMVHAFGALHPDFEDLHGEAQRIAALGLKGVKLHPEYQKFFADEERVFPLYEAVFALGLPVCFHAGRDAAYSEPVRGAPRRIAKVAERFPHGRIIAAHMGGLDSLEEAKEHLIGRPNVWMDTSISVERMSAKEIVEFIRLHGPDKFFFGTDAPWARFEAEREALFASGLSEKELQAIFWDNAAAFFGLPE